MSVETRLRTLNPRCGWVTGYRDCERDSCEFPHQRCIEVTASRKAEMGPETPVPGSTTSDSDEELMGSKCWCCGQDAPIRGKDDPWEGRLDGYCYDCSLARCDAYPADCPTAARRARRDRGEDA